MAIQTNKIPYQHGDTLLEGFFAFDNAHIGPRPCVLISHAWAGRDDFVCAKAEQLAALGYNAFALDMYGKGVLGNGPEENTALMQPLLDDRALLQDRLLCALQTACSLPQVDADNIIIMGYCFGGLCALDLARSSQAIKGAVSFHGLLNAPGNTSGNSITAKVLILNGHLDPMVSPQQVQTCQQELTEAGADWQLHNFGKAMHSFTDPQSTNANTGLAYNVDADRRSWQLLENFLEELL